jgi:hypothetical protein
MILHLLKITNLQKQKAKPSLPAGNLKRHRYVIRISLASHLKTTMRLLLLIALGIGFSTATQGQATTPLATAELSLGDCRQDQNYPNAPLDTIYFYYLPQNKLVQKIVHWRVRKFPIPLQNLPAGDYKIAYHNNFRQPMTKQVTLKAQGKNLIKLCPDVLETYSQNTLQKLQDKDSIVIHISNKGCYGSSSQKLIVRKERGLFLADWYEIHSRNSFEKITNYDPNGKLTKTTILDSMDMVAFNRFENELEHIPGEWCTYSTTYTVISKYWNIVKRDETCTWNGSYFLEKTLFREKNVLSYHAK